ncbi:DNA topoisomerase 2-alpha (DNA topoisomerase II [Durusdinium trenchii]|uniref:DNA topoisomerase 2 n=1 Tax=Durusdinium trenchii TaxID=1381693 RepID=A0ABP0MBN3_9DINO
MANVSHAKGREGKSIEQIYQKKTQLEHILLRPDTYVGSTEVQHQELWVFDSVQSRMVHRKISYVPALYKIFDEILVNAADNLQRDPQGMDTIKVEIDQKNGSLSVWNNGKGLPVVIHKEQKVYVPELVFGHLLTSDNYDDAACKVVGGRNGYGAKLANVFSTEFKVETCDGKSRFCQVFRNNMQSKGKPEIVPSKEKSFTCITFKPDLAKFGMTKLDDDIVSLLTKRVYDIAGSTLEKCVVHLNGEKLDIKNFRDYCDLYLLTRQGVPQIYEKCSDRWEICVSLTESGFNQVSFVNSICTIRGGTHVNHVSDQIVEAILEKVKVQSKEKVKGGVDVKPHHVKNHIWVFIKCLIENPAFDSQTKETLTTKQSKFGSRCELSEKFLAEVATCGVVDLILMAAMAKSKVDLGKKLKANTSRVTRLTGIPKLEDANDAGGKLSSECSLILTEGDSAKALAVSGLSVIGRDKWGVFPLRGKVLNVRDATLKQMMANEEIQNLIKIIGLDLNREYDAELKGLRYGSIMIMADQDNDGSHIKGLLINLIHAWWPSLARLPGFIKEFFTPIVKATKGKSQICFYTLPEYEAWKKETEDGKGFKIKYYKGLGTSTSKEAKEYFSALDSHQIKYRYDGVEDDRSIDLAFNKKRADDRKTWINSYEDGNLIDHTQKEVSYKDFVDKELVLFAKANVARAIPSMVDGFKPSQRKVLFGCFKRNLKNDVKVAQLVGYVSEQAAYHHGEASLSETIVGMAQDFVGSNNINLLVPQGQFGTRLQGGKDSASARYIYTRLSPITRAIFPQADDHVLEYLNEDGLSVEPRWYCPIIPMVLVNGVEGIGTGWSSSVPNFNPREIIANLRQWLKGDDLTEMTPWYTGFAGRIVKSREEGKFEVTGTINYLGEGKAEITELPVKRWTQDYREFLEEHLPKGEKKKDGNKLLEDYQEYHSEKNVHFELSLSAEGSAQADKENLEKAFKLRSSISLNNMMLFNADGKIKKYESALDILREFADVRLSIYETRKAYLLGRLTRECEVLSAKARFVKMVIEGRIIIRKRKIVDLAQDLRKNGFKPLKELKGESSENPDEDEGAEDSNDEESAEEGETQDATRKAVKDFEYLVGMPISTLTAEKVAKLMQEHERKAQELKTLTRKKPSDLWLEDLKVLETALDERDATAMQEEEKEKAKIQKAKSKTTSGRRSVKRSASQPAMKSEVKSKTLKDPRSQSVGRRGLKRGAPPEAA